MYPFQPCNIRKECEVQRPPDLVNERLSDDNLKSAHVNVNLACYAQPCCSIPSTAAFATHIAHTFKVRHSTLLPTVGTRRYIDPDRNLNLLLEFSPVLKSVIVTVSPRTTLALALPRRGPLVETADPRNGRRPRTLQVCH